MESSSASSRLPYFSEMLRGLHFPPFESALKTASWRSVFAFLTQNLEQNLAARSSSYTWNMHEGINIFIHIQHQGTSAHKHNLLIEIHATSVSNLRSRLISCLWAIALKKGHWFWFCLGVQCSCLSYVELLIATCHVQSSARRHWGSPLKFNLSNYSHAIIRFCGWDGSSHTPLSHMNSLSSHDFVTSEVSLCIVPFRPQLVTCGSICTSAGPQLEQLHSWRFKTIW